MKAFFITIPHSGEQVPSKTPWLLNLKEEILMCDVDRFVDRLYQPVISELGIPNVVARWHRYVVDLNRLPEDVDSDSVLGHTNPSGRFTIGLHWSKTTKGETLMPSPISEELHQDLLKNYYWPFHHGVEAKYKEFFDSGAKRVFQLDAHSMPSLGTAAHKDPGETRAEIVVSDYNGQSCSPNYMALVTESYKSAGFEVKTNWPYVGGRVTQTYGKPDKGQHCIQVEMNRMIYMDEETKQINPENSQNVIAKVTLAVKKIFAEIENL